jgi:hypothetical protein
MGMLNVMDEELEMGNSQASIDMDQVEKDVIEEKKNAVIGKGHNSVIVPVRVKSHPLFLSLTEEMFK